MKTIALEDHDDFEFADQRKRRLTPDQQKRFALAWKKARDGGKAKGPMKLTTAQLLLDAATQG